MLTHSNLDPPPGAVQSLPGVWHYRGCREVNRGPNFGLRAKRKIDRSSNLSPASRVKSGGSSSTELTSEASVSGAYKSLEEHKSKPSESDVESAKLLSDKELADMLD